MAFQVRNFVVLVYANGYTGWYYKTSVDSMQTCMNSGYFDSVYDMIAPNDTITISTKNGVRIVFVSSIYECNVIVSPLI